MYWNMAYLKFLVSDLKVLYIQKGHISCKDWLEEHECWYKMYWNMAYLKFLASDLKVLYIQKGHISCKDWLEDSANYWFRLVFAMIFEKERFYFYK